MLRQNLMPISVLALIFGALSACGNLPTSSLNEGKESELSGKWSSECKNTVDSGDGSKTSERIDLEFTEDQGSIFIKGFVGHECVKPHYTKMARSAYKVSSAAAPKNLDLVMEKMAVTAHNNDEVKALNAEELCGKKNWKADEEIDITELPCDPIDRPLKKGDLGFDIFHVSSDTVRFGLDPINHDPESDIGRKPETRPKELAKRIYTKNK